MEPRHEIDASEAYGKECTLQVVPDGTFGLFLIKWKDRGETPDELKGTFSHSTIAKTKIDLFLKKKAEERELTERRVAVREGKKKHAARKAKEEQQEKSD